MDSATPTGGAGTAVAGGSSSSASMPTATTSANGATTTLADEAQAATHRIHAALAPRVAVLTSADVDETLAPNNIDSFADLLKPFQESIGKLSVHTSQLETRQCPTFPLSFDHLDSFAPSHVASTQSLFTPADLVQDEEKAPAHSSSATQSKQHAPTYTRPEILLDAISARISSKAKALWESRPSEAAEPDVSNRHHRRKSSMYQANAVLAFAEESDNDVDLNRYRNAPIDQLTPWFADTRDMVLQARPVSEHETFGHPLAILLVVSSASSDPMNAFASLFDASQAHASQAFSKRPYVDPLVFRYYVLLHDVAKSGADLSESVALLDNVKKTYGLHCCLLSINCAGQQGSTRSDGISNLWQRASQSALRRRDEGQYGSLVRPHTHDRNRSWNEGGVAETDAAFGALIDDDDIRRVRTFVRDFAAQSLIPFMERCVSLWNEQLTASRRGLTGRLLGAGRKFFGASSRQASSTQSQAAQASYSTLGYYPHASLEAQTRRLADFAFMTRDYKLAATMYDLGRKDYANDKAHKYIAGANEMFGLTHLMIMLEAHSTPIDVDSYLASAGMHYLLAPRQKGSALQLDSLRATLLYYEAYQALQFYKPVSNAMVRTANEGSTDAENDLEVVAAMLLEQAALSNLRQPGKPALRKCALHLVMAAHRYRTCGQKHLSLRCFQASSHFYHMLRQASVKPQLHSVADEYDDDDGGRVADFISRHEDVRIHGWDLINDHMEQEMAQQAFNDGNIAQAAVHYVAILQRQATSSESSYPESAARHETYMQGLLTCCKYLEHDLEAVLKEHEMQASLALIDVKRTHVEVSASTQRDDPPWRRLEEQVLGHSVSSAYKTQNTAAVGETFWIIVGLRNPLNIPLTISALSVDLVDVTTGKAVEDLSVEQHKDEMITLQPLEQRDASLVISVPSPQTLRCRSIRYRLSDEVDMREELRKPGRRLNDTKEQRLSKDGQYAPNDSLSVIIHASKTILEAHFADAPTRLGLGEEVRVVIDFVNAGKAPLRNIRMHLNRPDTLLALDDGFRMASDRMDVDNSLHSSSAISVPLPDEGMLQAGQTFSMSMLLRGSALGFVTVRALLVFETQDGTESLTSQLQHTLQIEPVLDLAIQAMPARTKELRYYLRLEALNLSPQDDSRQDAQQERVVIDRLSFVSPSWIATVKQNDNNKVALDAFNGIAPHERRTTSLYIDYAGDLDADSTNLSASTSPTNDLAFTVEQLRSLLTGRGINASIQAPPLSVHFSSLLSSGSADNEGEPPISPFLLLARREYRLATLAHEFPSLLVNCSDEDDGGRARREEEQLERIFTLYEQHEIDVVAHWRIATDDGRASVAAQQRRGQSFIFGLHLGPSHDYLAALFTPLATDKAATRTMYAQTEREKAAVWSDVRKNRLHVDEDPITLDFDIRPPSDQDGEEWSHDFALHKRMTLDVHFIVRNLSSLSRRDVVLQLDNTSPPAGGAAAATAAAAASASSVGPSAFGASPSLSPPVLGSYVGRLTLRTTLAPFERKVLAAKVSIAKPGRLYIAPVLVRNTANSTPDPSQQQQRPSAAFQRLEFCPHVVQIVHVASS